MSLAISYKELFAMLLDMTVANGYTQDYTQVKSINNNTNTMKQNPVISLHLGTEEANQEGRNANQYRADMPIIIKARIEAPHEFKKEKEYEYDVERADCLDDIKKRFAYAEKEVTDCIRWTDLGEVEAKKDSNKNCLFVEYMFNMDYKTIK